MKRRNAWPSCPLHGQSAATISQRRSSSLISPMGLTIAGTDDHLDGLSQRALKAVRHRLYSRALTLLTCVIHRDPDNGRHYSNRGLVYFWQGQLARALADYSQAIRLNPRLDQAYNNRGNCYAARRQWHQALADYDQAVNLNPYNVRARINYGITLRDMQDYDAALLCFDEALMFHQFPGHIYAERGRTYHLRGDWNSAIADYRRALAIFSTETAPQSAKFSRFLAQRVRQWLQELLEST
ncbi:hypothetical protein XM38_000450 [Halomicronema hongdechloris C2206]|uniref:Uncharacterized protein n=1 Tax=Halomicronema hongdechloris C2206 TaxID=1641165 RepID=A0A1Z3HFR1_9CYAN|nr:tetratricopeptide repeat protein [Halomicronema hongdechloris]ASC69119.1 hypothetical protein XM38_000450 [Halomicronema hongdechloris C2206]